MKTILLALKISPTDVLPMLKIIEENVGNRKEIEQLALEHYKKTSKQIASPHLNPFRVRVAHSLRKLRLLQGENQNVSLTPEGKYLYSISENIEVYKKELSRILLQIDNEKCHILDIFQKTNNELRYNEVVEELGKGGIQIKKTDDKLRRWLQFLAYCEILYYSPPIYRFNSDVIEALESRSQPVSKKEFKKTLYQEYDKIKKDKGTYVSIPAIKTLVSSRLKNKGFTPLDFKEYLINAMTEKPDKKISLSETGVRQVGGILHNKTYYHFLTISEK
jgi:hypothetical protein